MAALFFASDVDIGFLADGNASVRFPVTKTPAWAPVKTGHIRTRDGQQHDVPVSYHPDAVCQALLEQAREAELKQVCSRLIVTTNVPLPGIMVDQVCDWDDLIVDPWDRMRQAGFLPDFNADKVRAFPDLVSSEDAARMAWNHRRCLGFSATSSHFRPGDAGTMDRVDLLMQLFADDPNYIRVEYQTTEQAGQRGKASRWRDAWAGKPRPVH